MQSISIVPLARLFTRSSLRFVLASLFLLATACSDNDSNPSATAQPAAAPAAQGASQVSTAVTPKGGNYSNLKGDITVSHLVVSEGDDVDSIFTREQKVQLGNQSNWGKGFFSTGEESQCEKDLITLLDRVVKVREGYNRLFEKVGKSTIDVTMYEYTTKNSGENESTLDYVKIEVGNSKLEDAGVTVEPVVFNVESRGYCELRKVQNQLMLNLETALQSGKL